MAIILMGSRSFALVVGWYQRFNCRNGRAFLRECLLEDDLASGCLVAPFKLAVPKGQAWYRVYRSFRQDDAALVAFCDGLMANVERYPG